jgi:SAM-dependent methyltransferase
MNQNEAKRRYVMETDIDPLRTNLRGMWASVADGWGRHADYVDERGAAVTAKMLELVQPRPGDRVLELACGPGGVGLAAAPLVGPDGEVVLSDVVPEMTAIAGERAAALGLVNVRTRVLDLEAIDEPDASYDVVVSREGLMFAPDHERAVREIGRVLRPTGRVVLAVWGPREGNPWLGLVLDAVGEQLGMPVPPPGIPGPFSLDDADVLAKLLIDAELTDVEVTDFPVPLHAASFDEWWTRTSALAGPVSNILAGLPTDAVDAIRSHLEEAATAYTTPTDITFPGLTLIATARGG